MKRMGLFVGTVIFVLSSCGTPAPSTFTVGGKVLEWSGKPVGGINISLFDSAKKTFTAVSDPTGIFSVAGVQAPYQLSVVPALGAGVVPISYDNTSINNPVVVIRKNAFANTTQPGFGSECSPTPPDGKLIVTLAQPVGVNNTGEIVFIAPGIKFLVLQSFVNLSLAAGSTIFNLNIPFDLDSCYNQLVGTVVYIERNAGGTIVAKGVQPNVNIFPGTTTKLNSDADASFSKLAVVAATPSTLSGTLSFPAGLSTATATTYLQVSYDIPAGRISKVAGNLALGTRSAYYPIETKTLNNSANAWEMSVENFGTNSKLQYRVAAVASSASAATIDWSDAVPPGAAGINLNLPSIHSTQQPSGNLQLAANSPFRAPNGNIIPEFSASLSQNSSCKEGNGYANNYVLGYASASEAWLGSSNDEKTTLPDTNAPAQIAFDKKYDFLAVNALCLRDASTTNSSDKLLDGRGVQRNFYADAALFEPDMVRGGVWNVNPSNFQYSK